MQKKSLIKMIVIMVAFLLIAAVLGYLEFKPPEAFPETEKPLLRKGLDLEGGVYVLLQAKGESGPVEGDVVQRALEVIRNRVDELGVSEPILQPEGEDRIRVELPGIENQQDALDIIGRTAQLRFVGPDGGEILTGDMLANANLGYDRYNKPAVDLELTSEGAELFAQATEKYLGQNIAIYLDEEELANPRVETIITGGKAQITGYTAEEAANLALMLRSGALPVELEELEVRSVGPTLGRDSWNVSLIAGAIGLLLVLIYMAIYYRGMGLFADFALIIYIPIVFAVLAGLNATITLPGIAGIILSIGMAVDANVIIFERIKEEYASGRTLRTAVEAGFDRAFRAILDANITTLIAAVVLFALSSGPVRGFAVTLSVGILVSMLTAIFLTRYLITLAVRAKVLKAAPVAREEAQ